MILTRRRFLLAGSAGILAAPAIVRYESLMRVKPISDDFVLGDFSIWVSDVRIMREVVRHTTEFWCSVDREKWRYVSSHQSGDVKIDVKIQEAVRA